MTLKNRIHNFNPGPSVLPLPVLEKAQADLLNFQGTGMSLMEISHRAKEFVAVIEKAETDIRTLLSIPSDYHVLFLQGGGSLQFSMIPLNFYLEGKPVDVVNTGYWSKKAMAELEKMGAATHVVGSSDKSNFMSLPRLDPKDFNKEASYFYLTSNNTIHGTQWPSYPNTGKVPLVADMTSDLLSRRFDPTKLGAFFAGAQKNLGPAGVTVVVLRKDLAERVRPSVPTMLQYKTHIKAKSLYNTPPTFSIYLCGLVFEWMLSLGGIDEIEKRNKKKAQLIYDLIDQTEFYTGGVEKEARSLMSVVFRVKSGDEKLENTFVNEAMANGFVGLKGHRSVGGLRASLYTPQPVESVQALVDFMKSFEKKYG